MGTGIEATTTNAKPIQLGMGETGRGVESLLDTTSTFHLLRSVVGSWPNVGAPRRVLEVLQIWTQHMWLPLLGPMCMFLLPELFPVVLSGVVFRYRHMTLHSTRLYYYYSFVKFLSIMVFMVLWLCQQSVLFIIYFGALYVQHHNCTNLFILFSPPPLINKIK